MLIITNTPQISTTNAVESWHRKLKRDVKGEMHKHYSILGTLFQVIQCSADWLRNAEKAEFRFRRYQSPICSDFPGLQLDKFPVPIQNFLFEQVNLARGFIEQCEPLYERITIPGWRDEATINRPVADPQLENQLIAYQNLASRGLGTSREQPMAGAIPTGQNIVADLPRCECRWFRAWQLPCAHIWHHHLLYGSLVPAHLAQIAYIWSENGYEIYEEIQKPFQGALDDVIGVPERVGLDWRERLELLNAKFYSITEWFDKKGLDLEAKRLGLQHFINEVSERLVGIEFLNIENWYQGQAQR